MLIYIPTFSLKKYKVDLPRNLELHFLNKKL